MIKPGITGKRPSIYSKWHRKYLPRECYVMDIDWVECKNDLIPRALLEVSEINHEYINKGEDPHLKTLWYVLRRTWFQRKTLEYISSNLDIPAFIVIHDDKIPLKKFLVLRITNDLNKLNWKNYQLEDILKFDPKDMTEEEYINFIKKM